MRDTFSSNELQFAGLLPSALQEHIENNELSSMFDVLLVEFAIIFHIRRLEV